MRFERLVSFLGRTAPFWILLVLFLLIEMMFFSLHPAFTEATVTEAFPDGVKAPDMAVAYTADYIYTVLVLVKERASDLYNRFQLVDLLFPLVYSCWFSSLLHRIYRRKYAAFSSYRWIVAVPFVAAGFDYLENLGFRIALIFLPMENPLLGWALSVFSTMKFLCLLLAVLSVFTGLGYFIKGRRDSHFADKRDKREVGDGEE